MKKKVISLLLCLVLVLGIGMTAYASAVGGGAAGSAPNTQPGSSSSSSLPQVDSSNPPAPVVKEPAKDVAVAPVPVEYLPAVTNQWTTSKNTLAYVKKGEKASAIAVTKGTVVCIIDGTPDKNGYVKTAVNGMDTYMLRSAFVFKGGKPKSAIFGD